MNLLGSFGLVSNKHDTFLEIAENMVIYQLRSKWLAVSKMYNEIASEHGGTMSMAFILLTINVERGTPVTKIAPRMGMEPNSLSRILKSMEKKGLIYRERSKSDRRKVYMCLTDYGKEMREVAVTAVFSLENSIRTEVSDRDIEGFFKVVNGVPVAMKTLASKMGNIPD